MRILLLCKALLCLKIVEQSPFTSIIRTDAPVFIEIPKFCHLSFNLEKYLFFYTEENKKYFFLLKEVRLFKPLRKMFEYESGIERGIKINPGQFKDKILYPDFSTQMLFVSLSGLMISMVFRFFG